MPVSKHRASRGNAHTSYSKGYTKGLLDALHALTADFEGITYNDDGYSEQCYRCMLVERGHPTLAEHFAKVMGIEDC